MNEKGKPAERERRDWTIILIILLLGFLCVILAGERAIRFSPNWKLDTNMRSNLDPDSDFLTNKPVYFYEPLDPSILTQPVWVNVFLTTGRIIRNSNAATADKYTIRDKHACSNTVLLPNSDQTYKHPGGDHRQSYQYAHLLPPTSSTINSKATAHEYSSYSASNC